MTTGPKLPAQELIMHGKRGKQRSVHNTYFTLPVIFAMMSNHYGFLYSHPHHWIILVVMMLSGALIRQFFVQRHAYHQDRAANPWPYALVGCVLILGVIVAMAPKASPSGPAEASTPANNTAVSYKELSVVLEARCYPCHGSAMQMKNIRLDSPQGVAQNALSIYQQAVVLAQMPMNNATGITPEERELIRRWYEQGAKTSP
jgi:uncharacterized membrane protein